MAKKIIKQNLRFYSKFLLLIGALIAFVCSFGVSSYAWHEDTNGNLVSDNILKIEDQTNTSLGVSFVCSNNQITFNGTATTSGPVWFNINIPRGTYTLQDYNNFTYNDGFRISLRTGYGSIRASLFYNTINDTTTFTSSTDMNILAVSVMQGVTYNNVVLKPTLVAGSTPLTSYEPYGATYYSESNMDKITHVNFGSFAFCDSIKVRYYNPNDLIWHDYKTFNNVYEFVQEKYVTFRNQSLIIDDFKLIFVELGGISDWRYQIYVHFPSNAIRVENYNVWAFTSANNVDLDTYAGSGYHATNASNLSLTSEGFSSSDYLKYIYYTRVNPNIATPTGAFGTPNSSFQYNQGYKDGYEVGKDDGFDSGFDDGKKEGIDIGYRDGYRDGEESDFTTNGFKTLIGSIFNYPINMIRSIFNFEFMGINIYSIIVFIMSIGIVIFVIRRFKK